MQHGIQGTDFEIWKFWNLLDTILQVSFWTFAFLFHNLAEEPRCLLGAASVNSESKTSMAIVMYYLNESQDNVEVE